MASSQKTPLGLNQWQPNDKPAVEDWNQDNTAIDGYLQTIIERGSNANGNYIKFADGTLICTKRIETPDYTMTTAAGGNVYRGPLVPRGSFAYNFVGTPVVQSRIYSLSGTTCWPMDFPSACALAREGQLTTTFTAVTEITAIGQWK